MEKNHNRTSEPYPTEDSEVILHKMVGDVIEVNPHMYNLKKEMIEMIHHRNLNEVYDDEDPSNIFV